MNQRIYIVSLFWMSVLFLGGSLKAAKPVKKPVTKSTLAVATLPVVTPILLPAIHLVSHVFLMQELKDRFEKNEPKKPISPLPASKQCATKAHLSVCSDDVKGLFGQSSWYTTNYLEEYKDIIDACIAREEEHLNSHYVFYHAQRGSFRVMQDILDEMYRFFKMRHNREEFYFLRSWHDAWPTVEVNSFMDTYEKNPNFYAWNDTVPELVKRMLCVNLSLFGNSTYQGECTFSYFVHNSSITYFDLNQLIENKIVNQFGFNKKYTLKLVDLINKYEDMGKGTLFEIFIPKDMVDKCVYLSRDYGVPYENKIAPKYYDSKKKRHTAISPVLDIYRNDPKSIAGYLDRLQGRIVFSQDMMLNPESGIKIYRYHAVDHKRYARYRVELRKVMIEMLTEWISSKGFASERKSLFASSPLDFLMRFVSPGTQKP